MFVGDLLEETDQVRHGERLRALLVLLVDAEGAGDAETHGVAVAAKESAGDTSRSRLNINIISHRLRIKLRGK